MDYPSKVSSFTAVLVNPQGVCELPDDLVMVRVQHNDTTIAEVVVQYGYRLVADASGVRVEPLNEWDGRAPRE